MNATKENKNVESVESLNLKIAQMKAQIKAMKSEKTTESVSTLFKKDNNEDYIIRNLNATCAFIERKHEKSFKAKFKIAENEKITISEFNELIASLL
jgi:hypothetical protein